MGWQLNGSALRTKIESWATERLDIVKHNTFCLTVETHCGTIREEVVEFTLKGYRYPPERVIVVEKLEDELIFGVDTLQVWKIKLDFVNEDAAIGKSILRSRLA